MHSTHLSKFRSTISLILLTPSFAIAATAPNDDVPVSPPAATIDLTSAEGTQLVQGKWRYADVKIVEVPFQAADADGQPTGAMNRTYDIDLHAGGTDFDDSTWTAVEPTKLN